MRAAARHVVAAVPLVLASCDERAPRVEFDPGPVPAEHAAAEQLFNGKCASCHGQLAAGTEIGPPLVHPYYEPNHHADIAFERAVAFGVQAHHWRFGPMPPIPGLDESQVAGITAYVRWLQRQAGVF